MTEFIPRKAYQVPEEFSKTDNLSLTCGDGIGISCDGPTNHAFTESDALFKCSWVVFLTNDFHMTRPVNIRLGHTYPFKVVPNWKRRVVSPIEGCSFRCIRESPFRIQQCIGKVSYRLACGFKRADKASTFLSTRHQTQVIKNSQMPTHTGEWIRTQEEHT